MLPSIYTASKCCHAPKWRELRAQGYPIVSTWIDEAGPGESKSLQDLALRCISESAQADITLLYCEEQEILKGALIEAGSALTSNKKVHCVGECQSSSPVLKFHPNWIEFPTVETALEGLLIPQKKWVQAALTALTHGKYRLQNEVLLHKQFSEILETSGIPHRREVILSPKNRIDFLLPAGIGIEAKINRAGTALLQQLARYTQEDEIQGLIVITVRPANLPKALNKKPIWELPIWNLLDVF